jgi:hypothetical protein
VNKQESRLNNAALDHNLRFCNASQAPFITLCCPLLHRENIL